MCSRFVFLCFSISVLIVSAACRLSPEEGTYANLIRIDSTDDHQDILYKAAHVIPTARQLEWQKWEMTAFLHFGVNTFTDNEWGDGQEDPKIFLPTNLDANQWVSVLREAGFKLAILTAKHHDGFCLWPSSFTDHSVKNSLWKNGQGDVVKELADACVKQNMKLGLYLSPWDRHEKTYGSEAYNDYYKKQLRELLTNYGPVDEVWFDGAVGEGPNGKKQIYDWTAYFSLVRELQPQAVIAIMGPDIRWVGTETGYGRETEWSVIPIKDTISFRESDFHDNMVKPIIDETGEDIASLEQLGVAKAMKWYPSEVDVSIRPGWFYHASEDRLVKSPEKLLDIYFNSVGKNSVLLLNIPPNRQGLIHEKDATILKVFSNSLRQIFSNDLARAASTDDNDFTISHLPKNVNDGRPDTYWSPDDGNAAPYVSFEWPKPVWFNILKLCEHIELGQRVAGYQLEVFEDGQWLKIAGGTTVGYTRLLRFPWVRTQKARIIFTEFRNTITISEIGFYQNMPEVTLTPPGRPFEDSLVVTMTTNNPEANIYYSQNYSLPSVASNLYTGPVKLNHSSPILAIAINPDGLSGFIRDEIYSKAKFRAQLLTTPSPQYMSEGALVLCDGLKGDLDYKSKKWLGFENQDLETIFDLGQPKQINSLLIHSLSLVKKGIYPPIRVSIYGSDDVGTFQLIKTKLENFDTHPADGLVTWAIPQYDRRFRFVKIVVSNRVPATQEPVNAFLFISEIEII